MNESRAVLNHGYVQLLNQMGNDLSVVRAARVSYNAEPRGDGSDEKLIHYLWKNRHTTPFESVVFTFEIKAPIFVFRQWHRHRIGWSYNEVSARYTELDMGFYVPDVKNIGSQSKDSKQARTLHPDVTDVEYAQNARAEISRSCNASSASYRSLLKRGVPRELARCVLPVAMYSKMVATCNLISLFHFLKLRLHPHAQFEIKVYAEAMLELVTPIVPTCVAAFREYSL